jgi:acetolactate synthase-1/2/3 large subunit
MSCPMTWHRHYLAGWIPVSFLAPRRHRFCAHGWFWQGKGNHIVTETTELVGSAFVRTLRQRGVEYVFANAGTDFAPVIESLAYLRAKGEPAPEFLAIPHENLAVAMAHGYHLVSGKPPVVMVHTTVGTANAMMGLMNAARDHIPLVLMAGRTPLTQQGYPASRNAHIHWGQESFDQGAMVREFVKWDYELRAGQPVDEILGRAMDIAAAPPCGPVYLTLPREVLSERVPVCPPTPFTRTDVPPVPGAEAIRELAALIAAAKLPLILTSYVGQDPAAVAPLAQLAEQFAIPVAQPNGRFFNMRASHPMYLGFQPVRLLDRADLLLAIDCEIPWMAMRKLPDPDARVVHVGMDPLHVRYPNRAYRGDLIVHGSTRAALTMLIEALEPYASLMAPAIAERRTIVAAVREQRRAELAARREQVSVADTIAPAWIGDCLADAVPADTIIANELGIPNDSLKLEHPGSFLGNGTAGGLGYAMGAALGAKLAARHRTVAVAVGNGSYMFGNPTPFHYIAQAMDLPLLTIVQNNSRWQAVDASTRAVFPNGYAAALDTMPIVDLSPSPDFCKVAEASGAYAERVTDPVALPAAIGRALEKVAGGQQALLDVITGTEWPHHG